MTIIALLLSLLAQPNVTLTESSNRNVHIPWDALLKDYVSSTGSVDYLSWKNDTEGLESYIYALEQRTPTTNWSKESKLAYWINAYNAVTVKLILDNYPLKSIRDLEDPWDRKLFSTGDSEYSLNQIEHEILRKMDEPRIHFAINCASISCPKLQKDAFFAHSMEKQLEKATYEFLNDETRNVISEDLLLLSKVFQWFEKDFGDLKQKIQFVDKYTVVKVSLNAKVRYVAYDWNLNE